MSRINYPLEWGQRDRDELDALFNEARTFGKWFFHGGLSGPLWFTPDELQAKQEEGKFVWGAVNWSLRDPIQLLEELDLKINSLLIERRHALERIRGGQ